MTERFIGAADILRQIGVQIRQPLDVGFINHRLAPRRARRLIAAPVVMQVDHPRLRRYRRAVATIGNAIAAVETFIVRQPAVYLMAAGVKQQLRRVEAVPLRWVPGPVDAVAVAQARPDIGEPAVPDIAAARGQVDASLIALLVKHAEFHPLRVGGKEREIHALTVVAGP